MAQFDRGAVPSMINRSIAEKLQLPITRRAPTPVQGIGGVITVTEECLLFIRIAGIPCVQVSAVTKACLGSAV